MTYFKFKIAFAILVSLYVFVATINDHRAGKYDEKVFILRLIWMLIIVKF